MTDLFKKNDRVLTYGKYLGTVYQDQHEGDAVVHVALDSQPNAVCGYYPSNLEKVPAEHEDYLKGALSVLVFEDVPKELFDLLTAGQHEMFTDAGSIKNGNTNEWQVSDHSKRGPIIDVDTTLDFQFKEGDRVKLKYNRNTGTVLRDQEANGVLVAWDHAKPGSEKASEGVKGGKNLWEKPGDLTVLHAPRATDPANPDQELIDQLEALRLPIKARIERDQAILSKLTAAQKILKKG